MEIVLDILWVVLQILAVLMAVVLLVPLRFRVEGAIEDGRFRARTSLRWGLGCNLTRSRTGSKAHVTLLGADIQRDVSGPLVPPEQWFGWQSGSANAWAWEHRRVLRVVGGRVLRALHLRGRVRGVIGLADLEQRAWAHQAVELVTANAVPRTLTMQCGAERGVLMARGHLSGWVMPVQLVVVAIGLLSRRDVRTAFARAEELSHDGGVGHEATARW